MLVFDIGSNKGQFTNACLAGLDDCKIVMVEPNPEIIDTLNSIYGSNPSIVDVLHAAATTTAGDNLEFRPCIVDNRMSTVSKFWLEDSRFFNGKLRSASFCRDHYSRFVGRKIRQTSTYQN